MTKRSIAVSASASFLIMGEALAETISYPDGSSARRPGGSPANVAVALARLGYAPTLLTSLGRDDDGALVQGWLADSGVTIDPASWGSQPTSRAAARIDVEGSATYSLDLRYAPGAPSNLSVDLIHVGSSAVLTPPGGDAIPAVLDSAGVLVSYDPNIRLEVVAEEAASRARVGAVLERADIVKVSDEDLAWLIPAADPRASARALLDRGAALVVLTQGAAGATAYTASAEVSSPSLAGTVVDTVGAGDTLMGALLAALADRGLLRGGRAAARATLEALSPGTLREVLGFAQAAAAVTVGRVGADPPRRSEIASPVAEPTKESM